MSPQDSKVDMNIFDSWHIEHKFPQKLLSSVAGLNNQDLCQI